MLVRGIISRCVKCRKQRLSLDSQIMSELPLEGLTPLPPFYYIGIDYFGSFTIRGEVQKRIKGKGYSALINCFTTRAVYADISRDYSTDSLLQVLRRFACVRGWPKMIYSDNGTQLVGASKELKRAVEGTDRENLLRFNAEHGTEWRFCPPDVPWMNGVTESLVKSIKRALSISIGEQVIEFSVLQTVMFEYSE